MRYLACLLALVALVTCGCVNSVEKITKPGPLVAPDGLAARQ